MIQLADKRKCTGCTACECVCPKACISMMADQGGFLYPVINTDACVECKRCMRACPILEKRKVQTEHTLAYAAYTKDSGLRMDSSSGGIFSEIAGEILDRHGVIYGAAFDKDFGVIHKCIESKSDLKEIRGAKYVQSDLDHCFKAIKCQLIDNRLVLFSGTPCQVSGLRSYLGKEYDNLICIDFVCHGVPSPMVWKKYLAYRAEKDCQGNLPEQIHFRCKDSGWSRYAYSMEFLYRNDVRYLRRNGEDEFLELFVKNYILRESCSQCKEKGYARKSDITLGDFWGIWDIIPEMDDNRGTSLVLVHSSKGKEMLKEIGSRIQVKEVTLMQAGQQNEMITHCIEHQKEREDAIRRIAENGFQPLSSLFPNKNETSINGSFFQHLKIEARKRITKRHKR